MTNLLSLTRVCALTLLMVSFWGGSEFRAQQATSPQQILQKASDYLKSSKNLDLVANIEFEFLLSPSLLAQYSGEFKVKMSRPNRLFVAYHDNRERKLLWLEGKDVTYLDVMTGMYARVAGQKTVESTVFDS